MTNVVDWELCRDDFVWDGSLRDIYIVDTTTEDWDRVIESLSTWGYEISFFTDLKPAALPSASQQLFEVRSEVSPLLRCWVSSVLINCHFFTEDEIEFDLDPRDVKGGKEFHEVLTFMRRLGQLLGKSVVLTPENAPTFQIAKYYPDSDVVRFHEGR